MSIYLFACLSVCHICTKFTSSCHLFLHIIYTGEDHHVKIVNLNKIDSAYTSGFGRAACSLGRLWNIKNSNARDSPGGGMLSLGTWKATRFDDGIHTPTKDPKIQKGHCSMNKLARSIASKVFPDAFKSITETMTFHKIKIPDFLGGEDGLCHQMVQSGHGFYCEAHFDLDVSDYSFAIWNSEDGSHPKGWYFLLPDVSGKVNGKEYEGIAIRLRDGVGIEWNGRSLHHCSTSPDNKNVFGTFFGVMKIN